MGVSSGNGCLCSQQLMLGLGSVLSLLGCRLALFRLADRPSGRVPQLAQAFGTWGIRVEGAVTLKRRWVATPEVILRTVVTVGARRWSGGWHGVRSPIRVPPDALAALEWDRQLHPGVLNPDVLCLRPRCRRRSSSAASVRRWNWRIATGAGWNPRFTPSRTTHCLPTTASRGYVRAARRLLASPERQEKLADQGNHVTNARAFQSKASITALPSGTGDGSW